MEKANHHYIPRHWLRRFRADNGNLWVREGTKINVRGVGSIMAKDYLYTIYDDRFNGSDDLENALSAIEGAQSRSLDQICKPDEPVGEGSRHDLVAVLALQVLRHPDVLAWGRRRAIKLAEVILKIRNMSREEFFEGAASLFDVAHPEWIYEEIQEKSVDELKQELADIKALSVQDSELAETDTLSALTDLRASLDMFHMRVLDIRDGEGVFVLGDTPVPQDSLASGFTVPLSKRVAVAAWKPPIGERPRIERGWATQAEIDVVNQEQWDRHSQIIVGESRECLLALPPAERPLVA